MEKYLIDLIIEEVRNFDKLKEEYGYEAVCDLIAHYIEGQVINSEDELYSIIEILKLRLGIVIDSDLFK